MNYLARKPIINFHLYSTQFSRIRQENVLNNILTIKSSNTRLTVRSSPLFCHTILLEK